jgi:hypothetical protein
MFSALQDFEPVVEKLVQVQVGSSCYDVCTDKIRRGGSKSLITGMTMLESSFQRPKSWSAEQRQQRRKTTKRKPQNCTCELLNATLSL